MGTKISNLKINIILVGIISAIMLRYTPTNKVYYMYLVVLILLFVYKLIKDYNLKIHVGNMFLIAISIISLFYLSLLSINELIIIAKRYLLLYIMFIYLYFSYLRYGLCYVEHFYKQLTIFLNVCSVLNLYQVIFHKPLLINYMDLITLGYSYHFGTSSYRTMSVFNHPIISGLFFIIAFLCNSYILKSNFMKYFLQVLLLVNIYTTYARSAWLALFLILIFYSLCNYKKTITFLVRPILTYKKLSLLSLVAIGGVLFLIFNFESVYNTIITRFGDSLSFNSTDESSLNRTMTISLILNYMFYQTDLFHLFFGYGAGTVSDFMLNNPVLLKDFAVTDNQYLSWFYEFGIIGILSYFALMIFISVKFFLNRKRHWVLDLSFLCLLVISFEFLFFEAWPVVLIMLVFLISTLTFNFKAVYS